MPSLTPSIIETSAASFRPSLRAAAEEDAEFLLSQTDFPTLPRDTTILCEMCPGKQCLQSPQEIFPDMENIDMQGVTCGEVEEYAATSNMVTLTECKVLKRYATAGECGGCGSCPGFALEVTPASATPSSTPTKSPVVTPTTASFSQDEAEDGGMVMCNLCPPGTCFQAPDELFPNVGDDVSVTCGAVEEFAASSDLVLSYCSLLKTYSFLGACGGCGPDNCKN